MVLSLMSCHSSWDVLIPGLQAATLLDNRSGPPGLFCGLCRNPDHSTGQCALSVMQQPASSSPATFLIVLGALRLWPVFVPHGIRVVVLSWVIVPSGTSVWCGAAIIGVLTAPSHSGLGVL